jgi:2,3-bisphosphoglycerate-independent phosphoglycerate mutase
VTRVIMLFLDGVGIGRKDARVNPLMVARMPHLRDLLGGVVPSLGRRTWNGAYATVLPIDATLGVAGLPQSGTGQTSLFTGVNAARLVGKHFGPHPYSTLRPVIEAHSIFTRLVHAGRMACFANAYPQKFFDYIERRPSRMTVTNYSRHPAARGQPHGRRDGCFGGYHRGGMARPRSSHRAADLVRAGRRTPGCSRTRL